MDPNGAVFPSRGASEHKGAKSVTKCWIILHFIIVLMLMVPHVVIFGILGSHHCFFNPTGVNFINILRTHFSYEHCFGSFFYVNVTREKLQK